MLYDLTHAVTVLATGETLNGDAVSSKCYSFEQHRRQSMDVHMDGYDALRDLADSLLFLTASS